MKNLYIINMSIITILITLNILSPKNVIAYVNSQAKKNEYSEVREIHYQSYYKKYFNPNPDKLDKYLNEIISCQEMAENYY